MVPVTSRAKNRPADRPALADTAVRVGGDRLTSPIEPMEVTQEPRLEAAKIPPLDVTGVRTVAVGACLWLVALAALLPFYPTLQDQGRGWWLWTCVTGFLFGLLGLEYCRRRRRRLASQPEREVETSPLGAAGL